MDGTTARFYENAGCVNDFHNKGFFKNLLPYESMLGAMQMLRDRGDVYVYVLSAVADSDGEAEKETWIATHLPSTVPIGCFFTRPGESKGQYVKDFYGDLTKDDILLDDYSANLLDWESCGGYAVKVLNEHNGRGWNGLNFQGSAISTEWSAEMIYDVLCTLFDLGPVEKPPVLTVMVGLPASGKTTMAQKIMAEEPENVYLSSDMVRKDLYGDEDDPGDPEEVFGEVNRRIYNELRAGRSVLYDASNLHIAARSHVLEAVPSDDVTVRFWVINTPLETCLFRNATRDNPMAEDVLKKLAKRYVAPKAEEYDGLCIIVNS